MVLFSSNKSIFILVCISFSGHTSTLYSCKFCSVMNSSFRSIFPYGLCWPQPSLQCVCQRSWMIGKKVFSLVHPSEEKTRHLLVPHWNMKCDFVVKAHSPEACGAGPLQTSTCPSSPGHPCSVRFSASFITPVLSCEVIGLILYLAANLSLTCNMQMLLIRCWLCSCCLFSDPSWFH